MSNLRRLKNSNYNGDLKRKWLLEFAQQGQWFTIKEAQMALGLNKTQTYWYVSQLKEKGLLKEQKRMTGKPSKAPMEYLYQDNWQEVINNPHPEVQKYVERLKHLAAIYRQGQVPAVDSIDTALTDIGNEIEQLTELVETLSCIYENPDLRRVNTFVKRMS